MTTFGAGSLRRFPVPEDWEPWAMIAWMAMPACVSRPRPRFVVRSSMAGESLPWSAQHGARTWCSQSWRAQRYSRYSQGHWLWELVVLANVALNIHFCHGTMVRSAGRSSKPLTPSGSSVGPPIPSSNILQKSLVTRRACLHQTTSNTLSGVGFWHPSLSTRADRKSVCASGSKCSCLCEGFFRRLDKLACGVHQGEFGRATDVRSCFSLEYCETCRAWSWHVWGWGIKVQTKCTVMEEIKQFGSVVRDAMRFTQVFCRTRCIDACVAWLSSSFRRCRSGFISKLRL